jgi:dimethylamine corrinoid protein
VVIATLEGDVHDLGKNILKMVLAADGYRVIDCGKDCPVETVAKTAQKEGARAVCISGLITPMIPLTRMVRPELARLGKEGTIIVAGGAALKMANAESLNVDCVCESAFDARKYLGRVLSNPGPA